MVIRIAILFYGYARTFDQLAHNYIRILPKDSDIFINTYDTYYSTVDGDAINSNEIVTYTDEQRFKQVFGNRLRKFVKNPYCHDKFTKLIKHYEIEEINSVNQKTYRTYAFFNSMNQVIKLKQEYEIENNFKYDCVILTRLDLKIMDRIVIPQNLNKLNCADGEGYVNGIRRTDLAQVYGTNRKLNDQILIGNSKIIDELKNIYYLISYYNKIKNIMVNNETLLGWHCQLNGIDFTPCYICEYKILR